MLILGIVKPKNLANSQAKKLAPVVAAERSVNPEPQPIVDAIPFVPTKPVLQPCLGCRQPFLRLKRPINLMGPKFPYEKENDYCGPCRAGILAQVTEDSLTPSQPIFYNPVTTSHVEHQSTSSTSYFSTLAPVVVNNGEGINRLVSDHRQVSGPSKKPRTESDFGERLRNGMATHNEALQQSEITTKTEEAMTRHRSTINSAGGGKAIGVVVAPQDSAPSL